MKLTKTINSTSKLLEALPEEDIQRFLKTNQFRIMHYRKNSILHFEGEPCHKIELILSGSVVVERIDESGDLLTISEFIQDELIAENLIFSNHACYPMTITVRQEASILEIHKEVLFELLSINPSFLKLYLEYMSDHALILADKINHYLNKTIRESLLNFLDYERKRQSSNCIKLNMTKKTLAEKLGVQRTSLSRELTKMKQDGLIVFDAKSITIL